MKKVLIITVLVFSVLIPKVFSQGDAYLLCQIKVANAEGMNIDGIRIISTDKATGKQTTYSTKNGKCDMQLPLDRIFIIDFLHADYYAKTVEVNTYVAKKGYVLTFKTDIDITMLVNCESNPDRQYLMTEPIGRIIYTPEKKNFQYDFAYNEIQAGKYMKLFEARCPNQKSLVPENKPVEPKPVVTETKPTVNPAIQQQKLLMEKARTDSLAKVARAKAINDSLIKVKAEQQRIARQKAIQDSLFKVARAKAVNDSLLKVRAQQQMLAKQKAYQDSVAKANRAKAVNDSLLKVKTEQQRLARQKAVQDSLLRVARAKAVNDSILKAKTQAQMLARQKAYQDSVAKANRAKAVSDSLYKARLEADRLAKEKELMLEKARVDSLIRIKAEQDRIAREKALADKARADSIAKAKTLAQVTTPAKPPVTTVSPPVTKPTWTPANAPAKFDETKKFIYLEPYNSWPSELKNIILTPGYKGKALGTYAYSQNEVRKDFFYSDIDELRAKFPSQFNSAFSNWDYYVKLYTDYKEKNTK